MYVILAGLLQYKYILYKYMEYYKKQTNKNDKNTTILLKIKMESEH